MIRPEKTVEDLPPLEEFHDWEWGDADMAPLLKHIRSDTAKTITDQIASSCVGYINESDGTFTLWPFGFDCGFELKFNILQALAEGEIEFDELDEIKAFTAKIDAISANLHSAIKIAEEATAPA